MKYLLIFLSLIFILDTNDFYYPDDVNYTKSQCDSIRDIGGRYYNVNKPLSQAELRKAADCYLENGYTKDASYCFLNISTLYEEMGGKLDSAIIFSNLSLAVNLDSMHQANIIKYLGYLHGQQGDYTLSEMYFNNAIKLYEVLDFEAGLNITYFNMARVKFSQKDYESSQSYLDKSIEFWKSKSNNSRIFVNSILGVRIGIETKNQALAKEYIDRNEHILTLEPDLPQSNIDTFFMYRNVYRDKFTQEKLD